MVKIATLFLNLFYICILQDYWKNCSKIIDKSQIFNYTRQVKIFTHTNLEVKHYGNA